MYVQDHKIILDRLNFWIGRTRDKIDLMESIFADLNCFVGFTFPIKSISSREREIL